MQRFDKKLLLMLINQALKFYKTEDYIGSSMVSDDYLPVAIFAIVGLLFPVLVFFLTKYFRPENLNPLKTSTYECGEIPEGEAQIQFSFQYYMYAIIFVIFDIVTVFLLIWALTFSNLSYSAKLTTGAFAAIFTSILLAGVYYALKKEETIWI